MADVVHVRWARATLFTVYTYVLVNEPSEHLQVFIFIFNKLLKLLNQTLYSIIKHSTSMDQIKALVQNSKEITKYKDTTKEDWNL